MLFSNHTLLHHILNFETTSVIQSSVRSTIFRPKLKAQPWHWCYVFFFKCFQSRFFALILNDLADIPTDICMMTPPVCWLAVQWRPSSTAVSSWRIFEQISQNSSDLLFLVLFTRKSFAKSGVKLCIIDFSRSSTSSYFCIAYRLVPSKFSIDGSKFGATYIFKHEVLRKGFHSLFVPSRKMFWKTSN